jgi:hypothetical protein
MFVLQDRPFPYGCQLVNANGCPRGEHDMPEVLYVLLKELAVFWIEL